MRTTIVVPVRDGERYLEPALRSLLDQRRPPDELIVVDDGSRDRSAAIAEALGARVLRRPATGVAAARNAGAAAATGELLGFLDADDVAHTRRLALQVAALAADPALDAVLGHAQNFLTQERADALRGRVAFAERPLAGHAPGALLIRRCAFETLGGFDEALPAGEAVDFFARLQASRLRVRILEEVVLLRRVHGDNTTLHDPALHAGYLEVARRAIARRKGMPA